jgi:hypothetical protein
MKFLTALVLAVATISSAYADFLPGRVRPGYKADMKTVAATGIYQGIEGAFVTLNYEDGKAEPVSISVSLPNTKKKTTLPVHNIKKSECGDHYVAYYATQNLVQTYFELTSYVTAKCERAIPNTFELSVKTSQPGSKSELDVAGNAEVIYVTM